MTLTERAATLFGEIAVAAGSFAADTGYAPQYVLLTKDNCDALLAYYETTKPLGPSLTINRQIANERLRMVCNLEVHMIRGKGTLRVG